MLEPINQSISQINRFKIQQIEKKIFFQSQKFSEYFLSVPTIDHQPLIKCSEPINQSVNQSINQTSINQWMI